MSDCETRRRQFLAYVPAAATAAAVAAGLAVSPSEGDAAGLVGQAPSTSLPQAVKSVRGSWFGVLTAGDGRTSRGLATFTPDGGLVTTNQGDTLASRPQGGGHGTWVQNGPEVSTRILKFVGNAQGVLTYIIEEVTAGTLDETGDVFVANASNKLYDLNGAVVEERSGTVTARRFTKTGDLTFPR